MKTIRLLPLFLTLAALYAQPSPENAAQTRLPDETLTLAQARAYVLSYEAERDQLDEARRAVFTRGANATPEERAKLIEEYMTVYGERLKANRAQSGRAEDLSGKIRQVEKAAAAPAN